MSVHSAHRAHDLGTVNSDQIYQNFTRSTAGRGAG